MGRLDTLPFDVFARILDHLSATDLVALRKCCKSIYVHPKRNSHLLSSIVRARVLEDALGFPQTLLKAAMCGATSIFHQALDLALVTYGAAALRQVWLTPDYDKLYGRSPFEYFCALGDAVSDAAWMANLELLFSRRIVLGAVAFWSHLNRRDLFDIRLPLYGSPCSQIRRGLPVAYLAHGGYVARLLHYIECECAVSPWLGAELWFQALQGIVTTHVHHIPQAHVMLVRLLDAWRHVSPPGDRFFERYHERIDELMAYVTVSCKHDISRASHILARLVQWYGKVPAGRRLLCAAARYGHWGIVERMLNTHTLTGWHAQILKAATIAMNYGHYEIASLLLTQGALQIGGLSAEDTPAADEVATDGRTAKDGTYEEVFRHSRWPCEPEHDAFTALLEQWNVEFNSIARVLLHMLPPIKVAPRVADFLPEQHWLQWLVTREACSELETESQELILDRVLDEVNTPAMQWLLHLFPDMLVRPRPDSHGEDRAFGRIATNARIWGTINRTPMLRVLIEHGADVNNDLNKPIVRFLEASQPGFDDRYARSTVSLLMPRPEKLMSWRTDDGLTVLELAYKRRYRLDVLSDLIKHGARLGEQRDQFLLGLVRRDPLFYDPLKLADYSNPDIRSAAVEHFWQLIKEVRRASVASVLCWVLCAPNGSRLTLNDLEMANASGPTDLESDQYWRGDDDWKRCHTNLCKFLNKLKITEPESCTLFRAELLAKWELPAPQIWPELQHDEDGRHTFQEVLKRV
ncbi:hypothetical protein KEM52_001867, partial [Ascosphaera acerosa]